MRRHHDVDGQPQLAARAVDEPPAPPRALLGSRPSLLGRSSYGKTIIGAPAHPDRLVLRRSTVENNGRTLGTLTRGGRFVTGKDTGALRGHQRCKRVRNRYSTSTLLIYAMDKVRRDRNMSETYGK